VSEPRFFAPDATATGSIVALPESEATHLTRVLRLKARDAVRVFNGRGEQWRAEVVEATGQRVTTRLAETVEAAPEIRTRITLAIAVLKGDKMDDVVRDAVMLGVTRIQPVIAERTEVTAVAIARGDRVARWQRIAIASAKQCGRAVVPEVCAPVMLPSAFATDAAQLMLVEPNAGGHPGAGAGTRVRGLRDVPVTSAVTLLVGPEGGWSAVEVQAAAASGVMLVTLGGQTLRADAAPMVAVSALRALWNDF